MSHSNTFLTSEQIRQRLKLCQDEIVLLKKALRAVRALEAANEKSQIRNVDQLDGASDG